MSAHATGHSAHGAHEAPMTFVDPREFKKNSKAAVANPKRITFRGAMNTLMSKRAGHFSDQDKFNQLRAVGESIRKYSLSRLPELLQKMEQRLVEQGVHVHWAQTPEQANEIFLAIMRRNNAKDMIKGKSMVSEEIELNHEMAKHGIECLESDMGEYIVQIAGEKPVHIIVPAIHKTVEDIAQLFVEKIPNTPYTTDVDELIQTGRRVLREHFRDASVGMSGVNFMVAETGSLVLVENEGNGQMCTNVPDVHIAITGIEKIVEQFDHIPPLFSLLTRSATGQSVTTYLNVINGPRREGEFDGPREMHLVLVDNGRSQAWRDSEFRSTLQCIRCGACLNHCPVYSRVGGHTYGTTYPGPIGSIISPHILGLDNTKELVTASSLCGACNEICPVGIPISDVLLSLRHAAKHDPYPGHEPLKGQRSARDWKEVTAFKSWAWLASRPKIYAAAVAVAHMFRWAVPSWQAGWTAHRTAMKPAKRGLRERLRER